MLTLLFPATAEELFFRVLFLPHQIEQASDDSQYFWAIISLILFVIYHPLNASLFMRNAKKTFSSFFFLISATILGIICAIAYLGSGSIYPSIVIHWIVVVIWLLCFGGYQKLNYESINSIDFS